MVDNDGDHKNDTHRGKAFAIPGQAFASPFVYGRGKAFAIPGAGPNWPTTWSITILVDNDTT